MHFFSKNRKWRQRVEWCIDDKLVGTSPYHLSMQVPPPNHECHNFCILIVLFLIFIESPISVTKLTCSYPTITTLLIISDSHVVYAIQTYNNALSQCHLAVAPDIY